MPPDGTPAKAPSRQGWFLVARLQSVRHAMHGIATVLRTQSNAWVHLSVAIMVIIAGWLLHVTRDDWRWLIAAIIMVWSAEAINTAIEYVCDVVSPEYHLSVKHAKDIAAAAVLICAAGAAVIGVLTFWPYMADH